MGSLISSAQRITSGNILSAAQPAIDKVTGALGLGTQIAGLLGFGTGTGFNLDEFRNVLGKYGVTHPNFFRIQIPVIKGLSSTERREGDGAEIVEQRRNLTAYDISLLCHTTTLPGHQIIQTEYRDHGLPYKIPLGAAVNDFSLQCYVRKGLPERNMFHEWQNLIINTQDASEPNINTAGSYDISYFNDVISKITIEKIDPEGYIEYRYFLNDCYPVEVVEEPVSWAINNEIMNMTVRFSYNRFRFQPVERKLDPISNAVKTVGDFYGQIIGPMNKAVQKIGGAQGIIKNLPKL